MHIRLEVTFAPKSSVCTLIILCTTLCATFRSNETTTISYAEFTNQTVPQYYGSDDNVHDDSFKNTSTPNKNSKTPKVTTILSLNSENLDDYTDKKFEKTILSRSRDENLSHLGEFFFVLYFLLDNV